MTSNNYNYKKKVDKVDNFIMTFLQNNNNLPTFHQHQSNTTTTEKKRGQNPVEVDNDDVLSTSRELQETVSIRVKTILNEDEQHNTKQGNIQTKRTSQVTVILLYFPVNL